MSCSFVPPYLLARLADASDDDVARCGRRALDLDRDLRQRRETAAPTVTVPTDADGTKTIYSADNAETLPGRKVRGDSDPPTGDEVVDDAFTQTGQVHGLFATVFGRSSFDDRGSPVTVTVHYGRDYDNAFWDGSQLVFGDGDGKVFRPFTTAPDVLFHEFTHAVTQFSANLTYQGQSGALNESMSDCFASMAKQRVLGQTAAEADWLIGEGLFFPGVDATALRSMKAPGTAYDDPLLGKDPQVGSMDDYDRTTDDNGGVHINSGIPNRAFYLAATALGGNSWETAGAIWYAALTGGQVAADADFAAFASACVAVAAERFGETEAAAVRDAWAGVGVTAAAGSGDTGTPASAGVPSGRVTVRRAGGFAGIARERAVDLDTDPVGPEVASLLRQTDFRSVAAYGAVPTHPDAFTYTFDLGDRTVTVPESALTPELRRAARLVLDDGD